ncbi:MAG: exodeoxyribonuclease VII large subunit [Eubacteriales bacterium]|nr:exodeoxyribonuclease VII large subunit [Eubacteriales bacterium]
MKNVYSVGQVNKYIQNMFTQDFMLRRIYVRGEVSNCKYHTSGHIYFSLKDETGSIACVMFAGNRKGLAFQMKNGQSVIVLGSVSVYERDGRYQLYAGEILLDGVGLLYEKYEALKKELEEMGMFADEYKQPLKPYIKRLGIVTAPTGAAVRDIMNIAYRRNPYIQLILYPALVQGEGAALSIVKGIEALDAAGVDTIIVGRGGGSIEDLWAFNEEIVARAIFECSTPIISAVGHETDFTIADFVADLRAPTPSAAAELAVADIRAVQERMKAYAGKLTRDMLTQLAVYRQRMEHLQHRLRDLSPQQQIREKRMHLMEREEKLQRLMEQRVGECKHETERLWQQLPMLMEQRISNARHELQLMIERLKGQSPLDKLNQGYSYTADTQGRAVTRISQAIPGQELTVYVADGRIHTQVIDVQETEF